MELQHGWKHDKERRFPEFVQDLRMAHILRGNMDQYSLIDMFDSNANNISRQGDCVPVLNIISRFQLFPLEVYFYEEQLTDIKAWISNHVHW